jgi:hypothetical protein
MATLDTKDVFTKVTNFHLWKLKFQHFCLHSFAFLLNGQWKEDKFYSKFDNLYILAWQKIKIANIHDLFGHVVQVKGMFVQISH